MTKTSNDHDKLTLELDKAQKQTFTHTSKQTVMKAAPNMDTKDIVNEFDDLNIKIT